MRTKSFALIYSISHSHKHSYHSHTYMNRCIDIALNNKSQATCNKTDSRRCCSGAAVFPIVAPKYRAAESAVKCMARLRDLNYFSSFSTFTGEAAVSKMLLVDNDRRRRVEGGDLVVSCDKRLYMLVRVGKTSALSLLLLVVLKETDESFS